MCRFLLAKFDQPTKPQRLLERFANMSKASKALDGDWQGDGHGIAWIDENNNWQRRTSLDPVWQIPAAFADIPTTTTLVAHARSASFPYHKGVLAYNQPYLFGEYAFVFNGLLKGVSLPPIPGVIGAEKISYLLQEALKTRGPTEALEYLKQFLTAHCREIIALNVGLATPNAFYSINQYSIHPDYYRLHSWQEDGVTLTCSEPLSL